MKTIQLIILLLASNLAFSQSASENKSSGDPLLNSVSKMFFLENFTYHAANKKKLLFDMDTAFSSAKVIVSKIRTSINYLQIINDNKHDELLFIQDSAWYVSHQKQELQFLGTGFGSAGKNFLMEFFPATFYKLDTLINPEHSFWRTVKSTGHHQTVSIDMTDLSEELEELIVEVTISNTDSLIYSLLQDAKFKGIMFNQYQLSQYRDYRMLSHDEIVTPGYFGLYKRVFPEAVSFVMPEKLQNQDTIQKIILSDIELYTLEGDNFKLPENGLIFLDLWYVGCLPCLKAAPVIEKLFLKYNDRIHFYGVNEIDTDKDKIIRFKESMGISFPVFLGGKEKLAVKINNSNAYPAYILIDASNGKILWKFAGYREDLEQIVREVFDRYL